MGNKPISIGLKTERTNYEAGSIVKGTVYVKVSPSSNDRVTGIHLVLDGEERVFVSLAEVLESDREEPGNVQNSVHEESQQNASKRRKKGDRMVKSHVRLVSVNVPIAQFPKALPRGEYEYPFEWELPRHLPPSMFIASQGPSAGVVHYQLTSYYSTGKAPANANGALYLPHQSATQKIQILATASPSKDIKTIQEHDEFPVSSCYCFPKGKVNLGFHVDRNVVSPGSRLQVELTGENFSEIPVSQLEVTLLEHVKLTAENRSLQRTYTLARETISTTALPSWQGRSSHNHSYNEALLASGASNDPLPLRLWVPSSARVSYSGKLIEVTHTLVVRAVTLWYASCPTLECSIKVGIVGNDASNAPEAQRVSATTTTAASLDTAAQMPEAEVVILPDDWRGQAADVIFIPPSMVMVDDDNILAPPSVVPTAPDESLLQSPFTPNFENGYERRDDDGIQPCEFTQVQAFLSNTDLLPRNPSVLARVRRLTPRQYVSLVCHPDSFNGRNGRKAAKIKAEDICRGRVLAACMGENFQCRHVLACLWGCPEDYRLDILREIAPLASDWTVQRGTVERELEPDEADYARTVLQWY